MQIYPAGKPSGPRLQRARRLGDRHLPGIDAPDVKHPRVMSQYVGVDGKFRDKRAGEGDVGASRPRAVGRRTNGWTINPDELANGRHSKERIRRWIRREPIRPS